MFFSFINYSIKKTNIFAKEKRKQTATINFISSLCFQNFKFTILGEIKRKPQAIRH